MKDITRRKFLGIIGGAGAIIAGAPLMAYNLRSFPKPIQGAALKMEATGEFGSKELKAFLKELYRVLRYKEFVKIMPLSSEVLTLNSSSFSNGRYNGERIQCQRERKELMFNASSYIDLMAAMIKCDTKGFVQFLRLGNNQPNVIIEKYKNILGRTVTGYNIYTDQMETSIDVGLAEVCLKG